MIIEILDLSLVGNGETVALHFTLEFEDLRDQESLKG